MVSQEIIDNLVSAYQEFWDSNTFRSLVFDNSESAAARLIGAKWIEFTAEGSYRLYKGRSGGSLHKPTKRYSIDIELPTVVRTRYSDYNTTIEDIDESDWLSLEEEFKEKFDAELESLEYR